MLTSEHSCVDERRTMTSGSREGLDVRFEELLSRCQTKMADQGFWSVRPSLKPSNLQCQLRHRRFCSAFTRVRVYVFKRSCFLMFCCYLM